MNDYYKKQYEETFLRLRETERKSDYYERLAHYICGMTNVVVYILVILVIAVVVIFMQDKWGQLSSGDRISLVTFLFAIVGVIFRYRRFIFNWPEELYFNYLQKEKEKQKLNTLS